MDERPARVELILASASPRRAELLASAGYTFDVQTADVDESVQPGEGPEIYVLRVARAKAHAVATGTPQSGSRVLAADTTVVVDGQIFGKPADQADAARMLTALAGRMHDVLTAVVVVSGDHAESEVVRTRVHFLPMTRADVDWYVGTGEPVGKAGAYAIQGRGGRFVDWIEGSWSNVVGLPVATVWQLLRRTERPSATP